MKQNIPNTPQRRFWCIPHVAEYIQGEEGRRQTPEKEKKKPPSRPPKSRRPLAYITVQPNPSETKKKARIEPPPPGTA